MFTPDEKTRDKIHAISICRPGYLESKWNESFANSTIILERTSTMVHDLILSKSLSHLHLLAIGAGAPFALDYVTRYKNEKNHLNSLILFNAITRKYEKQVLYESSILSTFGKYVYTLLSIGAGKSFALDFMGYAYSKLSMKYPLYFTNWLLSHGVNDTLELNQCAQYAVNNQLDLINHTIWNGLCLKRSKRMKDNDLNLLKQLPNDPTEILQQITVPTLILHSTVDKCVDFEHHSKYASQQIPNAKLLRFKGCGHWSSLGIGHNSNEWKNSLKDWLLKTH
jgi:pimeloyl-ACP methyl ester carboxylesterase